MSDTKSGRAYPIENQLIGDPTRLHQILINFAENAVKFSDKGDVRISVDTDKISETTAMAKFCIADSGLGIRTDRIDKIFESFEQAHSDTTRKYGGTGLGFSISKKLVELQKGEILGRK